MNLVYRFTILAPVCWLLIGLSARAADTLTAPKLVIVKAVYGDLPDGNATNVTAKVVAQVQNDTLTVEATNDNFGDPADGVVKKLRVEYTLNGVAGTKTVDENATLKIDANAKIRLIIRQASYGDLPNGKLVDVTKKVADLVNDNALSIADTNDNFSDPAEGIEKTLKVDYTFDGTAKSKTVAENDTLTISATGE